MRIRAISGAMCIALALSSTLAGCAAAVVAGAGSAAYVGGQDRTTGTVIEDQNIELKAFGALREDPELRDQAHISVTSFNNVVLLTGETPTAAMRERAESRIRRIEKVRQVYNELIIAAPSSVGSRSTDAWITTKVKSSLIGLEGLDSFQFTRVKVVTERGIVYLFGIVTQREADIVTDAVRRVDGVQRVVRLFEYVA